jgi:hypothetical protein
MWTRMVAASAPEDGIYWYATGPGKTVTRNDGAEIVLGQRLGQAFGTPTLASLRNDNSQFQLDLRRAGPVAVGPPGTYLALVIDGVILGVWSQSDREKDGTMNLACTIHGEKVAEQIATKLKAEFHKRSDPGHRFTVHWTPEKAAFEVGEPVKLKLEIRNTGTVPFAFRVGGQQRGPRDNQFRFVAYRASGFGKAVPDTGDPVNFGGISTIKTLQPKETFTATVSLDRWFAFADPDVYRVTGMYELQLHAPDSAFGRPIWDDVVVGDCLVRVVVKGK